MSRLDSIIASQQNPAQRHSVLTEQEAKTRLEEQKAALLEFVQVCGCTNIESFYRFGF